MEEDLLSDLIEYRKSKDKGVITASRGLLSLYREVNPGLLKRRERGKAAAMGTLEMSVPEYGHSNEPKGIDGLELLEEHLAAMRGEGEEMDEDDGEGWDDWELDSDAGSDSSGWEEVSSDGSDLEISDSDDEGGKKSKREKIKSKKVLAALKENEEEGDIDMDADADVDVDETRSVVSAAPTDMSTTTKKLSLLAQQKILTPADFALLNDLRLKAAQDLAANGGGSAAKRKLAALEATKKHTQDGDNERFLTEEEILGPRKKAKMDYDERMESIQKGREGRDKFGSNKGKLKKEVKSSSTNREKNKNKPIMMALQ